MNNSTDKEILCSSLKELLAESMLFGMQAASVPFSGSLFDDENKTLLHRFSMLNEKTKALLSHLNTDVINEEDIIPLYQEVVHQQTARSA